MSDALRKNYEVLEEIGRGKFGVVFRCDSAISGGSFAVKSIDKTLISEDLIDRQCIDSEVKIVRLLAGNPNVVQIFDVYEDDSSLHLVFELCDTPDLYQRICGGIFTEDEARDVVTPLMKAVAHCHLLGVAHRDIKPDNILFDRRNQLKLIDFGSAKIFREGESMRGVVGTPYYVAPEILSGRGYSEKVDIWSVGVILYIMLSGTPPFYGDSAQEIFDSVLRGNLRFPFNLFRSISVSTKDLLRRMICRDVSKRFSAEQVLRHPWMMTIGRETNSPADVT